MKKKKKGNKIITLILYILLEREELIVFDYNGHLEMLCPCYVMSYDIKSNK